MQLLLKVLFSGTMPQLPGQVLRASARNPPVSNISLTVTKAEVACVRCVKKKFRLVNRKLVLNNLNRVYEVEAVLQTCISCNAAKTGCEWTKVGTIPIHFSFSPICNLLQIVGKSAADILSGNRRSAGDNDAASTGFPAGKGGRDIDEGKEVEDPRALCD
jgi:hypothetical protein